jgi:5-oxoprolinase (ATP-hydrolysing)
VTGLSGDRIRVLQSLGERTRERQSDTPDFSDIAEVTAQLKSLYEEGFRSIAVCLLHSFTFQVHELEIRRIALKLGFSQVSVSCQLQPMSTSRMSFVYRPARFAPFRPS